MLVTTILRRRGTRLAAATAITLLLALAAMAVQASPAFAEGETLTVTKTGSGMVTSDPAGINCGNDCSEPYPSSTEQICIDGGACRDFTVYQDVTLTAEPAPGWAFQSWSANCSGTGATCTIRVNEANETVHATFNRISPPNDDFAAAQLISGANDSKNGTTKDATRETGEPGHGDHTVWYKWTAPHTGEWTVDTCTANIDSILTVYTDGQLNTINKVADNNNHEGACPGTWAWGSKLTFRAQKDQTYRIVVGDTGGARENTFTLALTSIPAPANDNRANAQVINGTSVSEDGTNVSATRESGDPWSGTGERSVWYAWTAPFSGSATLDTCTANYDSLLSVSINRFWGLESVANANNGCPSGFGDKLTFNAQNGQTYHIGVDGGFGAPAGTFTLALNHVDDVFPETTIRSGPQNGSITNDTSPNFTFDSSEPDSTFECRLYPSDLLTKPAFRECSGTGRHAESVTPDTYTFDVRATDPRGNTDQSEASRTWTVDTVAPNKPVITSPADNSLNNTGDVTLSGTAEANSTVEVFDGATSKGFTTASGSGNWTKPLNGVADGSHTYTAKAKDAAGNISVASDARTVVVDTAGPAVKSWKPKGKKVRPTAKPTVTFSEKMDETLIEASANGRPTTFVLKKGRKVIPATVTYTEKGSTFKAVLKPTKRLKAGAKYTASVTDGARDLAGNILVKKTWTFKVKR